MAEQEPVPIDNEEPEETPGYKAPAQKSLNEIQNLDADDESLVKYKQTLLAGVDPKAAPADDPRRVVVQSMSFISGDVKKTLDLTGDLSKLAEQSMVVKEGVEFKIEIIFKVQHEIISGLRYHHAIQRKGISVDKQSYMVGSYPPKAEAHQYTTPSDEAPKGMLARGKYKVKSKFVDDDKNVHLSWEWAMDIKKDWE